MSGKGVTRLRQVQGLARHHVFFAFLFSVFVNILMLTGPIYMLQVYDRVLSSGSEETLVTLTALVVFLYALMWLLDMSRTRLLARYGARFQDELDAEVFRASIPDARRPNAVTSPERDLEAVQTCLGSPAMTALLDTPFTPLFVAAIFLFHPLLGWLAVGGGILLVILTLVNQRLGRAGARAAQVALDEATRFRSSVIGGADLIVAQGMTDAVTERWRRHRSAALVATMSMLDTSGGLTSLSKAFRLTLQSLVLGLGAWLVLAGDLTAGAMIAASILLGRALAPIEQVLARWPQIERAWQGWRQLANLLDTTPAQTPKLSLPRPEARLEVAGLTVMSPGRKAPVLFNVTFTVEPGQAVGIIGRSGSGKTTIARALLDLVGHTSGEVRLGGALLSQFGSAALSAHVGFLPQDPVLVSGTIAENIARMSLEPDGDAVVRAARRAQVHDLILSLPDGYETRIDAGTRALSGGQRQRIALARALYGDPVLLVLDEPNSALDLEGTEALNGAVREMKEAGNAVVIMTHRPMAISECDDLIVVDQGRVTTAGPRDDVLKAMMRNAGRIEDGPKRRVEA